MAKVKIHGDSSDSSSTFFRWATTATRPQASSFISLCVSDSGGSLVGESRQAKISRPVTVDPWDDVIPSFWVNWYYPVLEGNITKCFARRCSFQDDEFCGKLCSFDALRKHLPCYTFQIIISSKLPTFRDVLPRKDLLFFAIYSIPVIRRISRPEVQEKCQQVALDFPKKGDLSITGDVCCWENDHVSNVTIKRVKKS